MGENYGTPDILLVSCIEWALLFGVGVPEPPLNYRQQVASRPGYKAAMACNDPSTASPDAAG